MATADEIRARVEQADRDRMAARADAAAVVADTVERRRKLREQLAELERELAQSVSSAEQVMTRKELATFLNEKPSVVDEWASAGSSRGGRRRGSGSSSRRTRSTSAPSEPVASSGSDSGTITPSGTEQSDDPHGTSSTSAEPMST